MSTKYHNQDIDWKIGSYDIFFEKPYEIFHNINDFMISIWYMIGSISFLLGSTSTAGYWFFIIGSIQLSLRPLVRIIQSIHLKHYRKN